MGLPPYETAVIVYEWEQQGGQTRDYSFGR